MFRKLVSNLSFSPALIHQVGFYAHRLKKEETTRRLTVGFMVLALVVQSLSLFSPPESANASSEHDLLLGGVKTKEELIKRYDANEANIKDILTATGISDSEVAELEPGTVYSRDNGLVMGRNSQFGGSSEEAIFTYVRSDNGQKASTYIAPLKLYDTSEIAKQFGTTYQAFVGKSDVAGSFAILKQSGGLVIKSLPSSAFNITSSVTQEISATNLSQNGVPANTTKAEPGDRISYTITAKNDTASSHLNTLVVDLSDVLEYAALIDTGTGNFDQKTKVLSWTPVSMKAGQTEQRTFVVQLVDPIPAMSKGKSNGLSYDCTLTSAYGTLSEISVHCPPAKDAETIVGLLPTIGKTENIIFAGIILSVVLFFYFRTRQLKKEIRLIRHNLNEGTL